MKKSFTAAMAIMSLLICYAEPTYALDKVLFGWEVKIMTQVGSSELSSNVPISAVKVTIMATAGLSPSVKNEYAIYKKSPDPMQPHRLLNEGLTLQEEGITDGSTLLIKPYP